MKKTLLPKYQSSLLALPLLFLTATGVNAQATADSDVFIMDPFVVSSNAVGYQVRNSLSGTKFDIQVREVPINITSLTQEFLEDTYSLNLESALQFTAGVTRGASVTAEEGGGFYIRGLRSLRSKRNGIVQLYTQDMTNVQRVEVVKGPMSLLYGQTEPGGIINYQTMKALDEFRTDVRLTVGNYDHYRAQLNHTGPIFKGRDDTSQRLLYRFDASYSRDDGFRENMEDRRRFTSALLEYKPFANTTVELQWDFLKQDSYNLAPLPKINQQWRAIWEDLVATTPPEQQNFMRLLGTQDPHTSYTYATLPSGFLVANTSRPRMWDGYAEHWDWKLNPVPENAFNDVDQHTYSLEIRQRLIDQWFARLYIVHHDINRKSAWGNLWGLGISGDVSQGYSWNHFDRYNDDWAYQFEITGRWNLGAVSNQSIIGVEYLDNKFTNFLAQGGFGNVVNPDVIPVIESNPTNPYFAQTAAFRSARGINIDLNSPLIPTVDEEKETSAVFVSNVARFFNERLLVLTGVRYDKIEISRYAESTTTGERVRTSFFEDDSVVPQVAASYRIIESINLYASYSESFVPQSGSVSVLKEGDELAAELPRPPVERELTRPVATRPQLGKGWELGTKFDFMESKISGSVSIFQTELTGVTKSYFVNVPGFLDANGQPQSVLVGSQDNGRDVKGFESELFLRPLPGLQFVISYAYIDSEELLANRVAEIREGANVPLSTPSLSVPRHQIGVWSKYDFTDGRLDGLSVGLGFTWMDKRYGAYQLRSGNPAAASFVGNDEDVEDRILLSDQITFDMLVAYKFKMSGVDCSLQLNVKNLLNERFIVPGGMPNDPRRVYLTLQTRF
jgi:iron complex outermembrane recepter protein